MLVKKIRDSKTISLLEAEPEAETKPECGNVVRILFDGGCAPSNPGNAYGSYEVAMNGNQIGRQWRIQFGHGTNNTAEFDALLFALGFLDNYCDLHLVDKLAVRVEILTDSTIVRNWIRNFSKTNLAKIKNDRRLVMAGYAQKCVKLLEQFHSYDIQWHGRENNVQIFGH